MNRTRTILLLSFLSLMCTTTQAQSLKELFLKMPQELCPLLSEYNRLEIVDNQKNGKPMETRNQLRTVSQMEQLTDDYAHLILSKQSEKQMKLLPLSNGTPIIMVISTVTADSIADSSIKFYDTAWKPLPTLTYFSLPPTDNFRQVILHPDSNRLTVISRNMFRLNTDGSDRLLPQQVFTNTFHWQEDKNHFMLDN